MNRSFVFTLALMLSFVGVAGTHTEAASRLPDLIVSAVSAPSTAQSGQNFVFSASIKNQGRASANNVQAAFYLTKSSSSITGATLLGTQNVGSLSAGATLALTTTLSIPSSTSSGTFYVAAMADPTKIIKESNETNNTRASGAVAVQPAVSTQGSDQMTVWVTDSLTRVQPTGPAGPVTTATLQAARNEYEGVQIIIKAPSSQSLSNVMVTASDLTGPGTIPSGNIVLYRESYIQVTTASPSSPYPVGWWPDPLIPLTHPDTKANLGQPFGVATGQNVPIYVEVYVPAGTTPGIYTGSIQVNASGVSTSVPLTLTVWNFTLPTTPSLRSNFASFRSSAFADKMGTTRYSAAHYALIEKFENELLRHRLSPDRVVGTEPKVLPDGSIDVTGVQAKMATYVNERGLTGWDLPLFSDWPWADPFGADRDKAQRYLSSILDWLNANGWLSLAYHDGLDEPRGASGYQAVRDEAFDWHSLDLRAKMLITEQTKPGDPTWGTLYGSVDIWTPYFSRFDPVTWAERRTLGEQSWMYGAWGTEGEPGNLLDRPIHEIRVPAWIGFQYGITGLLQWNTANWGSVSDPWTNPATYVLDGQVYNGDGVFFYPGKNIGYDGPIASLRLKAFRDAVDDYDYLTLMTAQDPNTATAISQMVGTAFTNWAQDATAVTRARGEIGQRLGGGQ